MNAPSDTLSPVMAFTSGTVATKVNKPASSTIWPMIQGAFQRRRKEALIGLAAVIVALGAGAYLIYASGYESTDDAYTTGHVHSISTRVAGTVIEVAVEDNEPVKKGQVLVRLDPQDFQIAVDKAQADYDRALADYNRSNVLKPAGAISQQEYDQMKASRDVALAALNDAKDQLSYCTIVAPADGVVGNKTVETGNRLAQGTDLMSVVQEVWIVANFKETQVGQMVPGQQVVIEVDEIPGHTFAGRIDSLSPGSGSTFALLPPENATGNFTKIVQRVPVKIVFDPESTRGYERRLVPGLSVEATVSLSAPVRIVNHFSRPDQTGSALSSLSVNSGSF
jgi:membrane fusion protein (multidrug efflux system)